MPYGQVQPLFITPLYSNNFRDTHTLNKMLQYVRGIEYVDKGVYGSQKTSANTYILDEADLFPLKQFVQNSIQDFTNNFLKSSLTLKVTQSWVNLSEKGKMHVTHTHPNSIFSGIFYFYTDSRSPQLYFHRESPSNYHYEGQATYYTSNMMAFRPPVGSLLIFPSSIPHSVRINESDEPRISLSFNTFAKDNLGTVTELTKLELDKP